jgi:hypothetical protein
MTSSWRACICHVIDCCCAQVDPLSNRLVVQPKAAAGDARTASGRTTSGRTASGRPTSAGQHHGYKGSLLFRPLPEVGATQQQHLMVPAKLSFAMSVQVTVPWLLRTSQISTVELIER